MAMAIGFCSDYVPIFSGDYVQGIVSCGYGLSWCRLSTYIYVFKHKYIYICIHNMGRNIIGYPELDITSEIFSPTQNTLK